MKVFCLVGWTGGLVAGERGSVAKNFNFFKKRDFLREF